MQKKMMKLEICGVFFVIVLSVFLQNLYELSGRTLVGIIFGSVNDSIWETAKTLLLAYLFWSFIELLYLRPPFNKFISAKIMSLYLLGIVFVLLSLIISYFASEYYLCEFISAIVSISLAGFASYKLTFSELKSENLFYPSVFMLLLFVAMFCSLTPFPPQMYIFMDRTTGLYGIIPQNIDEGAIVLDTLYNI